MNYTKPEVAVLGEAVNVIESLIKGACRTLTLRTTSFPPMTLTSSSKSRR